MGNYVKSSLSMGGCEDESAVEIVDDHGNVINKFANQAQLLQVMKSPEYKENPAVQRKVAQMMQNSDTKLVNVAHGKNAFESYTDEQWIADEKIAGFKRKAEQLFASKAYKEDPNVRAEALEYRQKHAEAIGKLNILNPQIGRMPPGLHRASIPWNVGGEEQAMQGNDFAGNGNGDDQGNKGNSGSGLKIQ